MPGKPALVWIDVETTGLEPKEDQLLEVGCIVTDANLTEIARSFYLVEMTDDGKRRLAGNDFVREMHAKSGLLREVELHGRYVGTRESELAGFIRVVTNGEKLPLAGSTIGFDRSFLAEYMPKVLDVVHYRSVDVSSLKLLAAMWGFRPAPKSREAVHRATPDLEDSIAELKWYRETMLLNGGAQ